MRLTAAWVLFARCLSAQQASLEGTTVNAQTGEPLSGVHVKLVTGIAGGATGSYGAISDRAGHFSIATVRPGTYLLLCDRSGFLYVHDTSAGLPNIVLKPGQAVKEHRIEMTPRAILAGRVVDENGDPVQGVSLEPVAVQSSSQVFSLPPADSRATDDHGDFRTSVAPGKYYLKASPPDRFGGSMERRNDGSKIGAYGPTFYPSSAVKERGVVVEAAGGSETVGLEIRLVRQQGFRVGGTVTGISNEDGRAQVSLNAIGDDMRGGRSVLTQPDGSFEFTALPPGRYHLSAGAQNGKVQVASRNVEVSLSAGDAPPVILHLSPGAQVSGTLVIEGDPPGGLREKLAVQLEPADPGSFNQMGMHGGEVDREHSFRIEGAAPSRYRVRVAGLPENAYLKRIEVDGQVATDAGIDLSSGGRNVSVKITVSPAGGLIAGRVLDSNGERLLTPLAMVVLMKNEDDRIEHAAIAEVTPDGKYSIKGIAPGKYRLLGVDPFQLNMRDSNATLKLLYPRGEEIEVKEGDRIARDVNLLAREDANAKPKQ